MDEYGRQAGERVLGEIPFGIWVARAPSREVLYANEAMHAILGIHDVRNFCGFEDRQGRPYPKDRLPFHRALAAGAPVVIDDLVVRGDDGRRTWVRAFANPVRDAQGTVSHVVVAFMDITAEVRAIVARDEIEKRLEVAVHHAPILLFTVDRDGILTASDGALKPSLLGATTSSMGKSLLQMYKDHPVIVGNLRRALAGETVFYSASLGPFVLDVWVGPVRDAAGELAGAIGVCTDVSEGRRVQSRMIQDDRIHAMGTLAASVAHEINNPLTYVLAGLEEADLELDDLAGRLGVLEESSAAGRQAAGVLRESVGRLRELLAPVQAGTKRIREVTRDLRTFARPDDENQTRVDLSCVVGAVLRLVRKEIEARARLVEELGAGVVVLANEARLVQVLTNLLINAWQAIPEPDPARHVVGVRTAIEGDRALIEIWDSGPGVPADLRERIFEPFVTTKQVGSGSGLGLFVSRNIVISLRGEISLHDTPGGGALFRVMLPLAPPETTVADPRVAPGARAQQAARRARVVIVDDDALVAGALAARLTDNSFDVLTVLDGRQGLELLLADADVDLAYCDLMMKGVSGVELHDVLHRQAPERLAKVVFMTGGAFTPEALALLERRPDACVHKPFDIVADAHRRIS